MATIVNVKFKGDANFETTVAEWEYGMHRFSASVDTKFQDEVKVGILFFGTTGRLHDHFCLTLGKRVDYEETREVVLNYIKSKGLTTKTSTKEEKPQWTDVSAVTKGRQNQKGTTKGKGKGKDSNGKGHGKTATR